ncbi:hypothetical protein [Solidesulfovibrio sp.]|uniref:hypothetical protein n=1 Tax=Solidesulfovibrio sp. TaxID=2910990 RepID=UPI002B1FC6E4|nr:hypothetical protein [Solidesulfovibrio sp.]MEA4855401.1 hypothetical protein [Solidesulfovibrio sp.]
MSTNIARRLAIGLGIALVVGSLTFADAGSARAQANDRTSTATPALAAATDGHMGGYGPMGGRGMGPGHGRGMMMGASYGQPGHMGQGQYHGGSGHGGYGGHNGGCW